MNILPTLRVDSHNRKNPGDEAAACVVRDFSRQEYLKKREEKKIEELEADLLDAETIFAGEKLSKKEIEELEYKRTVLDLAKKRKQAQEDLNRDDGYHMPTAYDKEGAAPSERYKVLTERYRCSALCQCPCCMCYAFCTWVYRV